MHPDTNVELGLAVQTATTVEDCKAACVRNTQCTGLDFIPTNPEADRCWLGGPWSGRRNDGTQPGVDHYDLDRTCTGKTLYSLAVTSSGFIVHPLFID